MSDFFLQNQACTVCSALFSRVTYVRISVIELLIHSVQRFISLDELCRNFAYRTKHTRCVALYFLGWPMSQFFFQKQSYTVCSPLFTRVNYVRFFLKEVGIHSVQRFIFSGDLCPIFAYRTRHTQCVALYFLGRIMSEYCLQNKAYTVCSALFPRVNYVRILLIEQGIHSVQRFISSGDLCPNFAYRTTLTQCVALYFLG